MHGRRRGTSKSAGTHSDGVAVTDPGRAVFLSYASQDAEAAQNLCNALGAAGVEVWFDQSELRGGDAWDQMIRRQVKGCYLFVPLISAKTQSRKEGYFRREWRLAVERAGDMAEGNAFLLPVVIDGTSDSEALVPEKFREVQWTRLPGGGNADSFAEHVRRLLSLEATTPSASSARSPGSPSRAPRSAPPRSRAHIPWVAGGLLILVAGYIVAVKFLLSKHAASPLAHATAPAHVESISEKSIAVLPFTDMSERHDQEYFADGMAEEILDLLVKIPNLKVIGRTSSFQFKGRNEDLRTIGARLGAAYVVEGSVRKAGSRVRVTAQLIDTDSGIHRWSETYDRDFGDVLGLQDEIATGIARALQLAVDADNSRPLRHLQSTEAYTLYLRGRALQDQTHVAQLLEAARAFDQALAIDPFFLRAAEALAVTYVAQGFDEDVLSRDAWQHAREAAERALRIDPNSAPAHGVLGFVHAEDEFDWNAAEAEFSKGLASNPRDPITLSYAAIVAQARGQYQEAQRRNNASLTLDPLNPFTRYTLGDILYKSADFEGAEHAFRSSLASNASTDGAHYMIVRILLARGQIDAALKEIQTEVAIDAKDAGLAMIYHARGRKVDSDAALARLVKESGDTWPYCVATVHAFRGERSEAFEWLEKARVARDSDLLASILGDPELAPLRADPRYKALLREMNL